MPSDHSLPSPDVALSCPFCGVAPNRVRQTAYEDGDRRHVFVVRCDAPRCPVNPAIGACGPWGRRREGDPMDDETAREESLREWNTRAA